MTHSTLTRKPRAHARFAPSPVAAIASFARRLVARFAVHPVGGWAELEDGPMPRRAA